MTCGIFEESFWRTLCIILILYSIENNFIKNQTIELSITEANPFRLNALTQEKKLRKKEKKENASSNGTEEYQRYDYVSRIFRSFTKKKKKKTGWYENYSHVNPRTDRIDYLSRHEKRPWKSLSNLTIVTWLFMEGHNVWILDARE